MYGITHAKVSIGYQYSSCPKIMWEIHAATMKGFEVDTSDIGGWSLDVHHHYNFHEGELLCNILKYVLQVMLRKYRT